MCPYYHRDYHKCIIYNIYKPEGEYHTDNYCMEKCYSYERCVNYQQAKTTNGGQVPPPYKYK